MTIEIGSVVVLKSGGPKMTVHDVRFVNDKMGHNGNECPLCGPYPRLDSSDGPTMATLMLAQQSWRSRHDLHAKIESTVRVGCSWMTEDGLYHDETFAIETLREATEDDETYGERRRRYRHGHRVRLSAPRIDDDIEDRG